jgi:hypothetical protein
MEPTYRISSTEAVSSDWFFLWNPEGPRWFIERIVLWATVEADGQYDHVRAIGAQGMVLPPEGLFGGYWFVLGGDNSPMGPTWAEIYKKAPAKPGEYRFDPCKEITDAVKGFLSPSSASVGALRDPDRLN